MRPTWHFVLSGDIRSPATHCAPGCTSSTALITAEAGCKVFRKSRSHHQRRRKAAGISTRAALARAGKEDYLQPVSAGIDHAARRGWMVFSVVVACGEAVHLCFAGRACCACRPFRGEALAGLTEDILPRGALYFAGLLVVVRVKYSGSQSRSWTPARKFLFAPRKER